MSSKDTIIKSDESNSPLLTSKKKTQKSLKLKREFVKKPVNEKSQPDESNSPLSTSKKKTPKSLKPNSKIVKKSSNENSKLRESSSTLPLSKKKTFKPLKTEGKIVNKSSNENPMPLNSNEMQKSQSCIKMPDEKSKQVNTKGTQKPQNPKPEVAKKGLNKNSGNRKEVKSSSSAKTRNEDMKNLGGVIFMCNGKTKRDCYHYRVMGVQEHKKELVMGIKPGMKLFLFDFDLKLMYGIYKASSVGGMKLEPAAFGGAFPLQVRFEVHKDCLPLPESVFKKAIRESYDERTRKFKTELTIDQAKKLTNLFKPAPLLHSNPQSVVHEPLRPSEQESMVFPNPIVASPPLLRTGQDYRSYGLRGDSMTRQDYRSYGLRGDGMTEQENMQFPKPSVASPALLLTEQEYRSYGLRGDRHRNLTLVGPAYDPKRTDQEREGAPAKTLFLSEKDYRTYGLKGRQENPTSVTPSIDTTNPAMGFYQPDPYNSYNQNPSFVDRYLSQPLAGPSSFYGYETKHVENDRRFHPETILPDRVERLYSVNASNALSEYNQNLRQGGGELEYTSAPVSSRYAFAGPSVIYR